MISMTKTLRNRKGQTITELMFVIPILTMLAGGAMALVYVSWQGIKTQQAANYAARIQGQERVAGGSNISQINDLNGLNGDKDIDPSLNFNEDNPNFTVANSRAPQQTNRVYGKYRQAVRSFFSPTERDRVYSPPPKIGANTDQVKVVRVMVPPKLFGMQLKPIVIESKAYGGEDPHIYALPRWGCTGNNCSPNDLYWQKNLPKGND